MIGPKRIAIAKRTKIAPNFNLWEVIQSSHVNLVRWPGSYVQANLRLGAQMILQPIRNEWGPIYVNSGWRNLAINEAVGGSTGSDHLMGGAFDIVSRNHRPEMLFKWILESGEIYFRQCILYKKSQFVHVSFNYPGQKFKRQDLIINK